MNREIEVVDRTQVWKKMSKLFLGTTVGPLEHLVLSIGFVKYSFPHLLQKRSKVKSR